MHALNKGFIKKKKKKKKKKKPYPTNAFSSVDLSKVVGPLSLRDILSDITLII